MYNVIVVASTVFISTHKDKTVVTSTSFSEEILGNLLIRHCIIIPQSYVYSTQNGYQSSDWILATIND